MKESCYSFLSSCCLKHTASPQPSGEKDALMKNKKLCHKYQKYLVSSEHAHSPVSVLQQQVRESSSCSLPEKMDASNHKTCTEKDLHDPHSFS